MIRFAVLAVALVLVGAASGAAAPSRTLVSYLHGGGFTGKQDSLTVTTGGSAQSSTGSFRISPRRLLKLQSSLRQARFSSLRTDYEPADPVADGYSTRVTYARKTITVGEGAKPPVRLQRVIDLLAGMLSKHG